MVRITYYEFKEDHFNWYLENRLGGERGGTAKKR